MSAVASAIPRPHDVPQPPRSSESLPASPTQRSFREVPPFAAALIVENPELLEFGGRLDRYAIGFCVYGDPDLPLVVALGGISAGRFVTSWPGDARRGWWDDIVGDGLAIDTTRYSVLGIDWLGGSGASSGPGHRIDDDDAGETDFPAIGTRDQARAIVAVLDHLGVRRAHAIVGASYGGMVALACGAEFPERFARAVVISAAHRTHPMATALRSLQRDVVRLGIASGRTEEGLRLARGVAMTTYRTVEEFVERFDSAPSWCGDRARFPVEDYLDHAGQRFARSVSPWSFLRLSESIDLHAVDPRRVGIPVTLVAVSSDTLVPLRQMEELCAALGGDVRWRVIDSIYGHDAFLKEVGAMSSVVREALD